MKTLIMSSSFTVYEKDKDKNKIPRVIDNDNGFLDNLKKHLTSRKCMVIISGKPKDAKYGEIKAVIRDGFAMSGLPFDEFIYVDDTNKEKIAEYLEKADCIYLLGGHLPTGNAFINELRRCYGL